MSLYFPAVLGWAVHAMKPDDRSMLHAQSPPSFVTIQITGSGDMVISNALMPDVSMWGAFFAMLMVVYESRSSSQTRRLILLPSGEAKTV